MPQDCHASVCSGGEVTQVPLPGDGPLDSQADCVVESCDLVNGVPMSEPVPAGTQCSDGGVVCDAVGSCVECLSAAECPGASGPCGVVTCDAGVCSLDPTPGDPTGTCFPFVCDGVSTSCPTTCSDDDDCNNQTCSGGSCAPLESCDLEWFASYSSLCFQLAPSASFFGVDAQGRIYQQGWAFLFGGGGVGWGARRLAQDGQEVASWSGSDGPHNTCSNTLGPFGGILRNCDYSWSGTQSVSFEAIEYGWGDALGPVSGAGSFVGGGASMDGAENVFWDAGGNNGGLMIEEHSVHDIQGNVLPLSTLPVPTMPSQVLPAGFDSALLGQLTTSEYAIDWAGNVSLTGTAVGPVDLGGAVLAPIGALDVVVAKFDAAGQHQWSRRFQASGSDAALVKNQFFATDGSVIVSGAFASADFGWGGLSQTGGDKYLVKLASDGTPVCAKTYQGVADTGPSGELVIARGNQLIINGLTVGPPPTCPASVVARLRP